MSKRCFLHLGLHKTGSTSAQQTFKASKKVLSNNNIEFPVFEFTQSSGIARKTANHSIPIYSLFCDDPASYHINIRFGFTDIAQLNQNYLWQLTEAAAGDNDLLLSGEDISLLSSAGLSRLTLFLKEMGFDVLPFALVRAPYSYLCSSLQQQIKGGSYFKLLADGQAAKRGEVFNMTIPSRSDCLARLLEYFGDSFSLFRFGETCLHPNGPVGYMVEQMKICNPSDLNYKEVNASMGNKWVRAKNLSNWYLEGEHRIMPDDSKGLRQTIIFSDDHKFLLTENEFKRIERHFVKEVLAMQKLVGEEFTKEKYENAKPLSDNDWQLIYLETLVGLQ